MCVLCVLVPYIYIHIYRYYFDIFFSEKETKKIGTVKSYRGSERGKCSRLPEFTTFLPLNRKNYSRNTRIPTAKGGDAPRSSYRAGVGSVTIVFGSSAKTVVASSGARELLLHLLASIFFFLSRPLIYRR